MGKRTEKHNVVDGLALTMAGSNQIENQFTLGEGWYKLLLRFNITLTLGTGSGALVDALTRVIENITLSTDVDGICVNASGRALYRHAQILAMGVPPVRDAFAAASATYRIELPIYFADPRMLRPEDTILNTARYSRVTLQITMGGVNRLLSTVGTSTVAGTIDVNIERAAGALSPNSLPILYPFQVTKPSVNPNNQQFIELERAQDLAIKRLMMFTSDSGDSWQGAADNDVLSVLDIQDQDGFKGLNSVRADIIQRANVRDNRIDGGSVITGLYSHDYVSEGSINDAEYTGDKSLFRINWTNNTPTGKFVHSFVDGVRALKDLG